MARPASTPEHPGGRSRLVRDVLVQSARDLLRDNGTHWAAAIAYYSLLSIFPLLLGGISIASFFVDAQWASRQATGLLGEFLPEGGPFIQGVIDEVVEARGTAGVLSLAALLWSGSRVFGTLTTALNVIHDVDERYGFGKRLLIELAMTLSVGVLFLLALLSGPLMDVLRYVLQVLPDEGTMLAVVPWLVPPVLLLAAHFLVYRYVPRGRRHTKSALVGAVVATGLFLAARPLFFFYLGEFAEYSLVYGSVGIVIVLLLWAWIVALIALFGGEIASHVQMMVYEGKSAREVARLHEERASGGGSSQRPAGAGRAASAAEATSSVASTSTPAARNGA